MENALERFSLYDFFGVLLSGALAVTICIYLNIPFVSTLISSEIEAVNIIQYVLGSYFIGLLFQGAGSCFDDPPSPIKNLIIFRFRFRENATSYFLKDNSEVITNSRELKEFRKLANQILNREENNVYFNKVDTNYVFLYCKSYLEVMGKNDKEEKINSIYALSRNLSISLSLCLLVYSLNVLFNRATVKFDPYAVVLIIFVIIFSVIRACDYSKYRVRVVLRHYKMLIEHEKEN